ncbi:bifunctional diguanylate cyclase/phosphodiesterase [sulfur-oxidizing endosymbiont of Gigantopelta aegis]|uniref:bifunctional diguanylate cyclase/phosphodiesterase n=1 Tax=sulfur-oxidizing endosymbiont of Gigantopelta aegis TaxID=2794934 RepID=UPI001BE46C90|nr:GGDEF domain-containing protein [sulfur-oxidizing endosymbiont of Gigantopelta aegis]
MIKRLSIKHYALGFILLYIIVFISSSYYAYHYINIINERLVSANKDRGETELITAYQALIQQHQNISNKFALWEEVHQQLDNTAFYSYWHSHRLYSSHRLPNYFKEVALYNKQGNILAKLITTTLPEKITSNNLSPYFIIEKNTAYLILTTAIIEQGDEKIIRGYLMTKSQVISSLLSIKQFNFIESESIKEAVNEKSRFPVDQLIEYLHYQLKNNDNIHIYSNILKEAIFRNAMVLIVFALLFYYLISFFLSRPLLKIATYIDKLNKRSESNKILDSDDQFHIDELEKVRHSLVQYQRKLKKVYLNLDVKNKELWDMAHHDALTGIYNRRAFDEHWKHVKDVFFDNRHKIALLLFDINHFKSINDSYGHLVGDKVLKAIAIAIEKSLRKGEKLYRIGGDEFVSIIQIEKIDEALYVAERCNNNIKNIAFNDFKISEPVNVSIGIAHNVGLEQNNINDLLWQADIAVYEAKKPGQSHIIFYSKKIENISNSIFSSKINTLVYDTIESGKGITMFYQPIINLTDNSVAYYETLLRIKKEDEFISPQHIFQLVEARKLECELDIVIFKSIEHDLKMGVISEKTGGSINVSGPSIVSNKIIEKLSQFTPYLARYKIILEITETSLITNINQASDNISQLKKLGFMIALDDFGSGYSSLSYLSSMPVDIVKFDISLIQQVSNKKQYTLINYLANMINEIGYKLVAEGIETEATSKIIKTMKFHYAQGFLYGKPSNKPKKIN